MTGAGVKVEPSAWLFDYPARAAFDRPLPKTKIYAHAKPTRKVRDLFASEIAQITWKYKLAPETINISAGPAVPEVQVFAIALKRPDLSEPVLRCIDRAISFPIIFEVVYDGRVKSIAAFKRPSEADYAKWVVGDYFESPWLPAESRRSPLPVVLDLAALYEQMLRRLMPAPPRAGESLAEHVERLAAIRSRQIECGKLEARLKAERQFNRKVELNARLRSLREELEALSA